MSMLDKAPVVTVAIDTEEDNWGEFAETGATSDNIQHMLELQDVFDEWGVRPTYLVNRPPLLSSKSVEVLGRLAERDGVEIGAHCHPWNTPPYTGSGEAASMMWRFTVDENAAKIREVTGRIQSELGVRPTTFRTGRWGFGTSVAKALQAEGYLVDCSVTPLVDWSSGGGPDFTAAPRRPYRFDPGAPLVPVPDGPLVELPATAGFLRWPQAHAAKARVRLQSGVPRHLRLVGLMDRLGLLVRRSLSPEHATASDMIRLVDAMVKDDATVLGVTFHSCTLLPGATPYVRSDDDRRNFIERVRAVLGHCASSGCLFATLGEVGAAVASSGDLSRGGKGDSKHGVE